MPLSRQNDNFEHPFAIGSGSAGTRSRPINQAVWPSNSPVLGIFFACCGVILAVSWPPGTPRGPSILRAISSSVNRCSSSRIWRGIADLQADGLELSRVEPRPPMAPRLTQCWPRPGCHDRLRKLAPVMSLASRSAQALASLAYPHRFRRSRRRVRLPWRIARTDLLST